MFCIETGIVITGSVDPVISIRFREDQRCTVITGYFYFCKILKASVLPHISHIFEGEYHIIHGYRLAIMPYSVQRNREIDLFSILGDLKGFPEIGLQIVVLIAVYEVTLGKAIVVHTSESVGLGQGVEYVLICDGSNDQILYMVASALAGCLGLGLGLCGCLCCKYALSRQHGQAHSQTQQQTYGLLFHLFPP